MKKALAAIIFATVSIVAAAQHSSGGAQLRKGNSRIDSLFAALKAMNFTSVFEPSPMKQQRSSQYLWGEEIEQTMYFACNPKGAKEARALELVCDVLDDVCRTARDSYVVRSHTEGKDSIVYAICLSMFDDKGAGKPRTVNGGSNTLYTNAREMVYFRYEFDASRSTNRAAELKHVFVLNDSVVTANRPFDYKPFMAQFDKAMKHKGVRRRTVHWRFDQHFYEQVKQDPDLFYLMSNGSLSEVDGKYVPDPGEMQGVIYSIPAGNKALADEMLARANATTLEQVARHPREYYCYTYDIEFQKDRMSGIFFADTGDGLRGRLVVVTYQDDEGYHIMLLHGSGSRYIPRCAPRLKKYDQGRKTMYK